MIMDKDINKIIIDTINEFNRDLNEESKISTNPKKNLYGEQSNLDSLELVSFIVGLEQNIEETFNTTISLADEKAMSQKNNPYESIQNLTNYIQELLSED
tara:strand:- start:3046 stop:3345 length:300 start_codon:yes stop_codon:yes gene_type:complete